ncbi:hypothetical protein DFH07DRAFT_442998 [Mycena maculata]|uniref:Uncharacterized protein n=1 Tax=Mycena maculata TaxID=230809 RepID=A0AAD7NFC8_9AGAR|nr:hypothetical protein DFH07DRAFT_442998 [Mycena maculata]
MRGHRRGDVVSTPEPSTHAPVSVPEDLIAPVYGPCDGGLDYPTSVLALRPVLPLDPKTPQPTSSKHAALEVAAPSMALALMRICEALQRWGAGSGNCIAVLDVSILLILAVRLARCPTTHNTFAWISCLGSQAYTLFATFLILHGPFRRPQSPSDRDLSHGRWDTHPMRSFHRRYAYEPALIAKSGRTTSWCPH